MDPETLERVLRPQRFESGDRDRDAGGVAGLDQLAQRLGGGEVDLGDAARFQHQELRRGREVCRICRTSPRKVAALRKVSGAWKATTVTSGTCSPGTFGFAGHQIVVPGTRSNCTRRVWVMLQMPCSSDSMMPRPTPCSIGSTMMAAAVATISMNSPNDGLVDADDLAKADDPQRHEQQHAAERGLRHMAQQRGAKGEQG